MSKKRGFAPSNSVTLESFTEDELALELAKRQKTQWQKAKECLQAPAWCVDMSTKEVMTDPVTLPCSHSIERKELERVFNFSHFHENGSKVKIETSRLLYTCPFSTCKKPILLRPEDTPVAIALKEAIAAESVRKHTECDKELQIGYDAIKNILNNAVKTVTKELVVNCKITSGDKDGKRFF